jgi:NAD(P)H-hydrate repair Nnr-like enzyme with NAD(P)H-hydrate dehydratase domain
VAIGRALTRRAHPGVSRLALECGLPAVVDADALNLMAENRESFRCSAAPRTDAPPGEAARLNGEKPAA